MNELIKFPLFLFMLFLFALGFGFFILYSITSEIGFVIFAYLVEDI